MHELIEHVVRLTSHRDRDQLDITLAQALLDLLRPQRVQVDSLVGEGEDLRWLERARLTAGQPGVVADPLWVDFESLPRLAEDANRQRCQQSGELVQVPGRLNGADQLTLAPLLGSEGVDGMVSLTTRASLNADQLRLLTALCKVHRHMHQLLDYSERDTLTGLLNRKSFDEVFFRAFKPVTLPDSAAHRPPNHDHRRAKSTSYWLGMVDIDHFKQVNDRHGHLIGDEVLLLVGRILRSSFRFYDRLYRFGGEEFVVLLRCDDEGGALLAFERFRQRMANYAFPQVGRITASVGFTGLQNGDSPSTAFERADKAVYMAKKNGRDRVYGHAQLVREGLLDSGPKVGGVELF